MAEQVQAVSLDETFERYLQDKGKAAAVTVGTTAETLLGSLSGSPSGLPASTAAIAGAE